LIVAGSRELVSFLLDGQLYGLDIRVVKEIHPNVSIVEVPLAPQHIRGLVNVRGQVVLVMDVAVVFGRKPRPILATSQIIILKTASEVRNVRSLRSDFDASPFGDKPVGFLVDDIGDVVQVPEGSLKPPPPHLVDANSRFVSGVANPDRELQIIIDARELVLGEAGRGSDRQGGQ
jgi:purine-binding chemotaxis protein CheW